MQVASVKFGEAYAPFIPGPVQAVPAYTPTPEGLKALRSVSVTHPENAFQTVTQVADQFERLNWKGVKPKAYIDKVNREWNELFYEIAQAKPDREKMAMEAGDVWISFLRLLKYFNISPEEAMLRSSEKHALRMQKMMQDGGKTFPELAQLDRLERRKLWKAAKLVYA